MVAADGDAAAAAVGDLLSRRVDCAWHVVGGGSAADASTGHVHGGPRRSELDGDAAPRTAAGASHQGDDVLEAPLGIRPVVHSFSSWGGTTASSRALSAGTKAPSGNNCTI